MEILSQIVERVNSFLWDGALLVLLLGTGIFYTVNLKFIQVRKFGEGMKRMFGNFSLHGKSTEKGLSSFQALATAIAAQVGTGNIAGAATAIASGGPGAIFWMWVSAFFGMATIYGEAVMAQYTRKRKTALLWEVRYTIYNISLKADLENSSPDSFQWLSSWPWDLWEIWSSLIPSAAPLILLSG